MIEKSWARFAEHIVTREDLEDALKQVLVSPAESRPRSENREPTREELSRRYRLERR